MAAKRRARHYQMTGVWKIHKFNGRALLADDMGLGKTYTSLLYAKVFIDRGPVVVICPASVKWNWQNEARMTGLNAEVLERMTPPADYSHLLKNPAKTIYILNYKILGSSFNRKSWNAWLRRLKPQLVIIDECHAIKDKRTQQSKNVKLLCRGIKNVIGVSGTPLTNRASELWPILNLLKPRLFPSFMRYAYRYCPPRMTPWGPRFDKSQRLDELHAILKANVMIRRRKKDVLKQLPPKTRAVVHIELDRYKEYKDAEQNFIKWLVKTHPKSASRARRAARMTRFGYLKRLIAELKGKKIKEWIDNFLQESSGKLIVFGVHRTVVDGFYQQYKQVAVKIDGSVPPNKRQGIIDRFTRDKSVRIDFMNITAGGVGINAQIANTVMFAELGWTPGEHIQAEDRAHRMGQTKPVTCYYLIGKGTIEERIVEMINEKQVNLDQVLDGKRTKEGFDLNVIMDSLETQLIKEKYAPVQRGKRNRLPERGSKSRKRPVSRRVRTPW